MDAALARRLHRSIEPYHALIYFAPEAIEGAKALGLKGYWMGYFATRAAPMGPVAPAVVTATFYNFKPAVVQRAIPDAWSFAPAETCLAFRYEAADAALRRLLGDEVVGGDEVKQAAELALEAAAACDTVGRPLAAAWQAVPVPTEPHLALWHAATVLREHRGDGHLAALVDAELDGCQVHVTFAGTGQIGREVLQGTRGWSDDEWDAAVAGLQARGWVTADGALTAEGAARRQAIEDRTDELALGPYRALGAERTARLHELTRPLAIAIAKAGGVPMPNPMGAPEPE